MDKPNEILVRDFMTASPHTIGTAQTLRTARGIMQKHGIRHLPVLEGGVLRGVLTARDIQLVESLRDTDLDTLTVEDAMTPEPYAIAPDTSLEWVAVEMAEHKYGSAIVLEQGRVVGVFTTVDALRALQQIVAGLRRPA
jgi:acetoin utilization protein AcuB